MKKNISMPADSPPTRFSRRRDSSQFKEQDGEDGGSRKKRGARVRKRGKGKRAEREETE